MKCATQEELSVRIDVVTGKADVASSRTRIASSYFLGDFTPP